MTELEERLRRLMTDDRLALPSPPDTVTRVQARMRRRHRLRRLLGMFTGIVVVIAVPVAVRLGMVAPAEPTPAPSPSVVAWLNEPTTPGELEATEPPERPAARPCAAEDVAAQAVVGDTEGAGGHILTTIRLGNASSSRCTLSGTMSLAGIRTERGTIIDNVGWKQYPATIDPGEEARVDLETSYMCDGAQKQYHDIVMKVLGRSFPLAGLRLGSTCPVRAGDWYVQIDAPTPEPRYAGLTATIQAPATVVRGSTVDYVVTLTNPGTTAVRLDPCPVYLEQLWKNVAYYRLNCAAGEIGAGASVRFAMRLRIDAETPLGPTRLQWNLAETAGSTAEATVPVEVTQS